MPTPLRRSPTPLLMALGLLLVPATGAAATAAEAEQPVNLSLRPVDHPGSYFDLTMEPGESRELTVALGNNGSAPMEVSTYPADAYTIINGGFGAKESGTEPTGTTTWVDYDAGELSLPAGQASERTVTVTVPQGTEPGQYITSLVLENAEPVAGSGDVALNQIVRQALPVTVEVPGPLDPAFEFGEAGHHETAGRSVVDVGITNTGNAHVEPAGDLTIRDDSGKTVSEAELTMSNFFASTDTTVETTLDGTLEPGDYTLDVSMTDPDTGASATATELPFTVEEPDEDTSTSAQQGGLPGINQDSGTGILLYVLGGIVLVLLGIVAYLIRRHRADTTA
ncbi:hypothetical protein GCM10011374_36810 [Kocuria dechangensis]|uniref:WxL Interacting Protein peptidoglycan binding domain-containing protein n=1 Tax=Kocuria dechangensis TaxID=1176249 RepID=A0A917H6Y5_9MICC|nr:DUF916 domain-containing protein [Kocuria dechangensis]GGG69013.1 hypothetical protein GCM10011374_36810 [Kocuria dechangensis]